MVPYVVRQGEHLHQIAHRMGFDPDAVWKAPDNADLRKKRPDPNILASGDILYVPDSKSRTWLPVNVGSANKFVANQPKMKVGVKLAIDGKPCSGERYTLSGGGTPPSGTTGSDGLVSFTVPITTTQVTIVLVSKSIHFPVLIGHLDPIDTSSGVSQRLAHLGYLPGGGGDPGQLSSAISQFQAAQSLPTTGAMDDATRDALVKAHGA